MSHLRLSISSYDFVSFGFWKKLGFLLFSRLAVNSWDKHRMMQAKWIGTVNKRCSVTMNRIEVYSHLEGKYYIHL